LNADSIKKDITIITDGQSFNQPDLDQQMIYAQQ
jgi:hypothetical protein